MLDNHGHTPTLLQALRTDTKAAHDALESLETSRAILDGTLTAQDYRSVIQWQRRAFGTLEPLLHGTRWGDGYNYVSRLPALGEERVDNLESVPERPLSGAFTESGLPEAVGVTYVIEGSSLGGSLILKRLLSSPQLGRFAPFPFYTFQRDTGLDQWRRFVAFAKTRVWSQAEVERTTRAAGHAFHVFAQAWRTRGGEP